MSRKARAELKAIILQRIEFLLVLIDSNACGEAHPIRDNQVPDNMFEAAKSGPNRAAAEQSEIELTQLTRSLIWLESSSAGLCEHCARPVSIANMKSNPVSRLCETCSQSQSGELND